MPRRSQPERTGADEPLLPGFRDLAARRRDLVSDLAARRRDLVSDLAARRRAAGLSQADVAVRMGSSQPAVARLEAGDVDLRFSTLERYAAAIGCRIDVDIVTGEEEET